MTSPIGGSLGDSAEARMNEFSDELGSELSDASRHVRRSFERERLSSAFDALEKEVDDMVDWRMYVRSL